MSSPPQQSDMQCPYPPHSDLHAAVNVAVEREDSSSSTICNSGSLGNYFHSEHPFMSDGRDGGGGAAGVGLPAGDVSPCNLSPWHHSVPSPYAGSPWNQIPGGGGDMMTNVIHTAGAGDMNGAGLPPTCLIGSLVREEGHIYSLATKGELLYTGSDSKNIRVWKEQQEFAGFKCSSGLVKAIIISGDRIFSGHQDGKIRVWKVSPKDPTVYKRAGSLPMLKDFIKCSLKPSNYVDVGKRRNALWIKHHDAISCLSLNEEQGLLYSGSWDKTFKVWRIADSKCLESITAHDDTVNAVVAARFDSLVFTGSADGTVKVWKRELKAKGTRHVAVQTPLKQESAVTALAVGPGTCFVYSGSSDGLINYWEWERQQLVHGGVLRGHKLAVLCLAAAGNLILSGSADKTICVWRRDEGAVHVCLSVLNGHGGPVKCIAVEADYSCGAAPAGPQYHARIGGVGQYTVYTGSLDKSVKVWRVSEQAPDALLQGPQHMMYS